MTRESAASRQQRDFLGLSLTALCGGALAVNLVLIAGILLLIGWQGGRYFWQRDLTELELDDGSRLLGEIHDRETIPGTGGHRLQLKVGNRDFTGSDFVWVDEARIVRREMPAGAVLLERLEWGNFYGRLVEVRADGKTLASGSEASWRLLRELLPEKRAERDALRALERGPIGDVNYRIERLRLAQRRLELAPPPPAELDRRRAGLERETEAAQSEYHRQAGVLFARREAGEREKVVVEAADGQRKELAVGAIVHALRPNTFGPASRLGLYLRRVAEFVADDPRESNTEGGIFPALFGTVMMVFLMAIAVVPLGVFAALYLREYARQGPLVRLVRIAVNNLAGVPSIVFGVFGLGFFVYTVGGTLDRLFFPEALPTPTFGTGGILWSALTLALLTVPVVIVATEEGLAAVPRIVREGSLALGATRWETTWRVVVPAAAPGILTGLILAMARAAGEVAPLMIVGMVKLAPALPIDGHPPFVHFERKFMHLGFHIYDLGFQSPNVDATRPLVFATALLLILLVTAMNLVAIAIRNRLRRRFAGSAV